MLNNTSSLFRLSHIVETIAGVRFGLPKVPETFDLGLPPLTRYPLCLQLATFLPQNVELKNFRQTNDGAPALNTILKAFDSLEAPVLLLISATSTEDSMKIHSSSNSPMIFGIFSNAKLGLSEDDTDSDCSHNKTTQIFQLQPRHSVFSSTQPSEMRLSCDRERPQKSGMIFEGPMRGGCSEEMERTSLMLVGKDKEGKLERPADAVKFNVDNWWLLVEDLGQDD